MHHMNTISISTIKFLNITKLKNIMSHKQTVEKLLKQLYYMYRYLIILYEYASFFYPTKGRRKADILEKSIKKILLPNYQYFHFIDIYVQ